MVQPNNDDEFKIPSEPHKVSMEEAATNLAEMCSVFYNQLIKAGIPEEAATAMSVEYTHVLTCNAVSGNPHGE